MKKVILLGSTGSIGRNTIKVIEKLKTFRIVGIGAYANYHMLIKQAKKISPRIVTIIDKTHYSVLKKNLSGMKVTCGEDGIIDMVENADADIIVCAFASAVGIFGIIRAIKKKMRVCLATKEILVSFGDIIMDAVKRNKIELLPIDSEHSAIYQCIEGRGKDDIKAIILTASGGPFLNRPIRNARKADVLKHPVWKMGAKITVDSATMMNKGLEVIEASYLFDLPPDKIKVVIHPEALCHSLVQFIDGSLIAQLSIPDMKLPIQYALTAPRRISSLVKPLDLTKKTNLRFMKPNYRKFPCLKHAYEALKIGKSMPAVLNAANEEAVKYFLEGRLKFNEIAGVIKKVMAKHTPRKGDIYAYLKAATWSKEMVRSLVC